MEIEPIGFLRCEVRSKAAAPRQAVLAAATRGVVEFVPGRDWTQALDGLAGFERLWLIFHFHEASDRGNKVRPPGADGSVGVLATRSPHRPNPIGLSCVELEAIRGKRLWVRGHDLIDGTPVLDVKPYLPFADAFPRARTGWHAGAGTRWRLAYRARAWRQLHWLAANRVDLFPTVRAQLELTPLARRNRRLRETPAGWELSVGTWRVDFTVRESEHEVLVEGLGSAYAREDSWPEGDPHHDVAIHRRFLTEVTA